MPDKARERWYLDRFASTCKDFPAGQLIESEKPDFLIESHEERVGIELTRYYVPLPVGGRPPQEQEALRSRIIREAKDTIKSTDKRRFHVNVQFALASDLQKQDVQRISDQLAEAVRRSQVEQGKYEVIECSLPPEIENALIVNSDSLTDTYW